MMTLSVLLCEAGIRLIGPGLSRDLEQIRAMPRIAAEFQPDRANQQRILFLGNSLFREGVDPELVESGLQQFSGGQYQVRRATADATGIPEWYYAFKRFFADAGQVPDVMVLGFAGDSGGHFSDSRQVMPDRLAQHYSRLRDIPELFRRDVTSFDQRCDFMAASVSWAWANRERVQKRVLDAVVPGYRTAAQRMNDAILPGRVATQQESPAEYTRLKRLIALAQQHDVELVFLAIPIGRDYEIDPGLSAVAGMFQIPLIDGRQVPGITHDLFPDGYHMNSAACERFSKFVAHALAQSARNDSTIPRGTRHVRLAGHRNDLTRMQDP